LLWNYAHQSGTAAWPKKKKKKKKNPGATKGMAEKGLPKKGDFGPLLWVNHQKKKKKKIKESIKRKPGKHRKEDGAGPRRAQRKRLQGRKKGGGGAKRGGLLCSVTKDPKRPERLNKKLKGVTNGLPVAEPSQGGHRGNL